MTTLERDKPSSQKGSAFPDAFPWDEVMGFLMGVLGWPPHVAWAATPREVSMALNGRYGQRQGQAMNGAALNELMQDWPD